MKILCVNWQNPDDGDIERQQYPNVEFVIARSRVDVAAEISPEVAASVDAVINYSAALNVPLPPTAFPRARIAVRSGVGYDNIDTAGWGARNIPACNVPDYGTTEVADHAIALMLALTRGTYSYHGHRSDRCRRLALQQGAADPPAQERHLRHCRPRPHWPCRGSPRRRLRHEGGVL